MARTKMKVCTISGVKTSEKNFYKGHNHVKAVDNFRRTTGATREQMMKMFNQINNY